MKRIANQDQHRAGKKQINLLEQQHEKMERLEGQLHDYETKVRVYSDAVHATLVEPAKGWVESS